MVSQTEVADTRSAARDRWTWEFRQHRVKFLLELDRQAWPKIRSNGCSRLLVGCPIDCQ